MFLTKEDTLTAIRAGWTRIESLVPLYGRKFYGAFYVVTREYRVRDEIDLLYPVSG
jgi:hypothetical protein